MIGPAVIAALEFTGVALVAGNDERAAMGALVMDDADFALGVAHQNDRFAADKRAHIIPGFLHLAFVSDINPCHAEDALQFQLEDGRIGVDLPVHATGLNEAG